MNTCPKFIHSESLRDTPPDRRDVSGQCAPTLNQAGAGQVPVPPRRSLRVLCIDDDEMVRESMKDCLAHLGHRVEVASGGKQGIEMFCAAIPGSEPYDVIITDMNMPEVNGYAVAQTIKAQSPETPVILLTGAGHITMDAGSLSASVDTMVNKPPCIKELNDLLLRMARPA
jgi:two-component system capsular synthesis sensor histidine kinase RcsC